MRYIISGKNLDITEGLRSAVTDKLGKLERYFTPDTEVHVTLSVEKERQKIEVTIPVKGNIIRSEQSSTDMYVSIDLVEEVIERQLRKYKNKLVARQQGGGNFQKEFLRKRQMIRKLISSVPRSLISSPCILKMHVSRWNFWDITFSHLSTQRPMISVWFIREKAEPTVLWSRTSR